MGSCTYSPYTTLSPDMLVHILTFLPLLELLEVQYNVSTYTRHVIQTHFAMRTRQARIPRKILNNLSFFRRMCHILERLRSIQCPDDVALTGAHLDILGSHLPQLRIVTGASFLAVQVKGVMGLLRRCRNLIYLQAIDCVCLTTGDLVTLLQHPTLKVLKLRNCHDVDLAILLQALSTRPSTLTRLEITVTSFSRAAEVLSDVAEGNRDHANCTLQFYPCTSSSPLTHLDLTNSFEVHRGLTVTTLANLHNLQVVNVSNCTGVTDELLSVFTDLRNLRRFHCRHCRHLTVKGFFYLKCLPNLHTVDAFGCMITVQCMALFRNFPVLQTLDVSSTQVDDEAMLAITSSSTLRTLHCWNVKRLTDVSIRSLCRSARSLRSLHISSCPQLTGAFLHPTYGRPWTTATTRSTVGPVPGSGGPHLPHLETLNVSYCRRLATPLLNEVCKLRTLRCLDLSGNDCVTDDTLSSLRRLPTLERLRLNDLPQLHDDCVRHFVHMSSLRNLSLRHCHNISTAGFKRVRELRSLTILDCTGSRYAI